MNRIDHLTAPFATHLANARPGLEIAPWHAPILPKCRYPGVITLDIYDQATLRVRARLAQPPLSEKQIAAIEPVDFIGDASCLADAIPSDLHGKLAYIVSSHNFEHLPNPIRFLRDCENLLANDGFLALAIPDKRGCFDHWRPLSSTGQMIEAFALARSNSSLAQQLDSQLGRAYVQADDKKLTVFPYYTAEQLIFSDEDAFPRWQENMAKVIAGTWHAPTDYISAHCWTMIPESFALILHDLRSLGLTRLSIHTISPTQGAEFFVHLRKSSLVPIKTKASRSELCRRVIVAQSEIVNTDTDNPRRYQRVYAFYLRALRFLDKVLAPTRR